MQEISMRSYELNCNLFVVVRTYLSMALQPFVGSQPLFSFLILYTVGRTPWTSDQSYLHTEQQTQNERTQISMPRMGLEPTTPVFERAVDRATMVRTYIT
jgi:hypothetical protein